jgi:hypothetical protein
MAWTATVTTRGASARRPDIARQRESESRLALTIGWQPPVL